MKLLSAVFLAGGVALFAWLIARQGIGGVLEALEIAGWGVAVVALWHFVPLALDAAAWRRLIAREHRPPLAAAVRMRWIGESVNGLLPAAQVVGELVRVRLSMLYGIPGAVAGATMTVDMTIGVFSQVIFTLLGLMVLYALGVGGVAALAVGPLVLAAFLIVFLALQNAGMFGRAAKLISRSAFGNGWIKIIAGADAVDAELKGIYGRRRALVESLGWRILSWFTGTGEIWLGLHFLGHPVSIMEALMMESLTQAVRSAAFIVPGGLGIQEGGFILIGNALGISPELSLALSLIKRVRELAVGLPALVLWKVIEGRRLLRTST